MTSTFTEFVREVFLFFGGVTLLIKDIIRETFRKGKISALTMEQIYQIGERSLPLVLVTAACTGAVMTMQFGQGLAKFGGTLYVPRLVTVSILREMGPVFTAPIFGLRIR